MTDTPAHMDSFAAPELVLDRVREAGVDAVVGTRGKAHRTGHGGGNLRLAAALKGISLQEAEKVTDLNAEKLFGREIRMPKP